MYPHNEPPEMVWGEMIPGRREAAERSLDALAERPDERPDA